MRRIGFWALHLLFVVAMLAGWLVFVGYSSAAELRQRSVVVDSPRPSVSTRHSFQMDLQTTAQTGSIAFEYCANSPLFELPCTPPAGLDVRNAVLSQQTGNTGFIIDTIDTTPNRLVISHPVTAANPVTSRYTFDNIVNPSGPSQSVYVRLSTYLSTQGSGNRLDAGAVAFAVTPLFEVGAYVPPFLNLCVGVTVTVNCSQSVGDSLDLGVLSPQAVRAATSELSASTNDANGYQLYALGTTMTSGNNVIPNILSRPSQTGINQFGFNLRRNNTPSVGDEPLGAGTATPTAGYNSPNIFSFNPGDLIAVSSQPTDYTHMTSSYIVNVNNAQPPGIYATTITYLATAQF